MSAYTGRYQSRLFNFIAEQSVRLTDTTAKAFRHARFAAQNAVRVALYPLYALVQSVRRVSPSFHASANAANALPDADSPIRDTLDEVRRLDISETPVRGIASSRCDRHLLLVTAENEVLDVLSPQQQHHLDRYLLKTVATYWHKTLDIARPTPKPYPVRIFQRWLGWMQRSPLAVSLNWFDEATLPPVTDKTRQFPPLSMSLSALSPEAVAALDRRIAYLESEYFLPIAEDPEPWPTKLRTILQAAIDYFFGEEETVSPQIQGTEAIQPRQSHLDNSSQRLREVIQQAIAYFFGEASSQPLPSPRLPDSREADVTSDPWLSEAATSTQPQLEATGAIEPRQTDLDTQESTVYYRVQVLIAAAIAYFFGFETTDTATSSRFQDNPRSAVLPDPWSSEASPSQLPGSATPASFAASPTIPHPASVSVTSRGSLATATSPTSGDLQVRDTVEGEAAIAPRHSYPREDWQPEFKPEWIDASVMDSSYVKHPLEIILEWLDRIMLKIETWIGNLLNRLFKT